MFRVTEMLHNHRNDNLGVIITGTFFVVREVDIGIKGLYYVVLNVCCDLVM